jgi:aldose 1-epimerase
MSSHFDALAPGSTTFDNFLMPARLKAHNLGRGQDFSMLQIVEAIRKETRFDFFLQHYWLSVR